MTASREERTFRGYSKKCIRGEARQRLLENLGLREVEEFILRERKTDLRGEEKLSFNSKLRKYKDERFIVGNIMRKKLRENSNNCI